MHLSCFGIRNDASLPKIGEMACQVEVLTAQAWHLGLVPGPHLVEGGNGVLQKCSLTYIWACHIHWNNRDLFLLLCVRVCPQMWSWWPLREHGKCVICCLRLEWQMSVRSSWSIMLLNSSSSTLAFCPLFSQSLRHECAQLNWNSTSLLVLSLFALWILKFCLESVCSLDKFIPLLLGHVPAMFLNMWCIMLNIVPLASLY